MLCHGSARFVRRAVESIQIQHYTNIELVLFDLGVPSDVLQLMRSFRDRDQSIKLYGIDDVDLNTVGLDHVATKDITANKPNFEAAAQSGNTTHVQQVYQALLNQIIHASSARWFFLMDSAFWLEPHLLDSMVKISEEKGSEIVFSGYDCTLRQGSRLQVTHALVEHTRILENQEALRRAAPLLLAQGQLISAYAKLMDAQLVQRWGLELSVKPFRITTLSLLEHIKTAALLQGEGYHSEVLIDTADDVIETFSRLELNHQMRTQLIAYWNLPDTIERMEEAVARRYIEELTLCIESITQSSSLSSSERRRLVTNMLHAQTTEEAIERIQQENPVDAAYLAPIRSKSAMLACLQARISLLLKRITKTSCAAF